ncbi:MAG: sugar ABC transporter permease [Anaerolineae bacterium]|nr:sugar ABC transporter permease [Anaerolineae bacterium]
MNLSAELSKRFRQNIQTYAIVLALVALWILFAVLTEGRYLRPQNISNLFRQMSVTALMATGMVLVIVLGNIDLSVGKAAGVVSCVAAFLQDDFWHKILPSFLQETFANQPALLDAILPIHPLTAAILSVILGLLVGTLIFGILQGYIIAYLGVPAFIVTLGGLFVARGLILWITQGQTIASDQAYFREIGQGRLDVTFGWILLAVVIVLLFVNMFNSRRRKQKHGFALPNIYLDLAMTVFFSLLAFAYVLVENIDKDTVKEGIQNAGIQVPVLLLGIVAIIMIYVSNNTRFGRYAYAIGGNREAARLSGINIQKQVFGVCVLMGFLASCAGIVLASYVGYGTIAAGEGYELDVIAAAILGGTSTLGGEGTIFGALIGALIMTSLVTGLQMMNVESSYQYLVRGMVLVLAVYLDVTLKKNR